MTRVKIFNDAYIRNIAEQLVAGKTLSSYYESNFSTEEGSEFVSTVELDLDNLNLDTSDNVIDKDVVNSIKIYESLEGMDAVQASDSRLWTHLTHVELRGYVMKRWPLKDSVSETTKDENVRRQAINFVLEHWFVNGTDRQLRRNAVARLWWAAYLTVSPWEKYPERFKGVCSEVDPYLYTRTLFLTQDIFQTILERGIGRDTIILITFLDYIRQKNDIDQLPSRDEIRTVVKEINLMMGVQKISLLSHKDLSGVISNLFLQAKKL